MQTVFAVMIFCVILFLYLHIYFHIKTSNDLEVYEIDQPSKDKLEEVCDLRQPVLFDYANDRLMESCTLNAIRATYGAFDVRLRNVKDTADEADATDLYVPLTLHAVAESFRSDKESRYISENNGDFLEETGLVKTFKYNDSFLRPPMVSKCVYDVMCASPGTATPLRYELNYRNYYLVTHGTVKMRLIAPNASKYLYPVADYDNFEFRSPVNPWQPQAEYRADFDKIKTMDVDLSAGQIIYIPAYWWCSMQFPGNPRCQAHNGSAHNGSARDVPLRDVPLRDVPLRDVPLRPAPLPENNGHDHDLTTVCCFKYHTYMSTISVLDKLGMWLLQQQNVKRDTIEKKITGSTTHATTIATTATTANTIATTATTATTANTNTIATPTHTTTANTIATPTHTTTATTIATALII